MANSNEYMKEYMARRRRDRRNKLISMAGGKCGKCDSVSELEFNHINRKGKSFNLSGKDLDRSWARIVEEFNKCELLCGPCHLGHTRQQYLNQDITPWNKGVRGEYYHGTPRMYHDKGCRCAPCKEAKRLYRAGVVNNNGSVK